MKPLCLATWLFYGFFMKKLLWDPHAIACTRGAILSTDLPEQQGQQAWFLFFLPFCYRSSLTQSPCAPLPGQINAYLMPSPARPTAHP
jgi:hypothetical protein